jgi:sensor histidine kinase YesM
MPSRIVQHLAFWGLAYYILVHLFASSGEIQPADHIYTVIFLVTVAAGVYVNLLVLIPLLLNRGRFILYGIALATCVVATAGFNQVTFSHLVDYLLPGYYFISYYSFTDILKFMAAFFGLTSLLKLARGYFLLMEARNELMQLQKEKSDAELQALRAQVNPHFLFNSLNSIYALVLKKSDNAPETVLRLSEILRYILYETRKEQVELATEIRYMQDYISLQRLRCGALATIDVHVSGEADRRMIAPLLFLPLLENCFKHGIKGETGPSFVRIAWEILDGSVRFTAENNKGETDDPEPEQRQGIGIENLRKRLGLAYPGKHHLEISDRNDRFTVTLTIQTSHET